MSYSSIAKCASDPSLAQRINSCIAQEQSRREMEMQPSSMLEAARWHVAVASDVEQAYESALAAENPDPGGDPAVISDQMILSNVQANWPAGR